MGYLAVPQLAGWVYLPAGASTNAIAQVQLNLNALKSSNAGQWEVFYTGPSPMVEGQYLLQSTPGIPSDNHDAVACRIGDNGIGPSFEFNILGSDAGVWARVNDVPYHIMLWRLPQLR